MCPDLCRFGEGPTSSNCVGTVSFAYRATAVSNPIKQLNKVLTAYTNYVSISLKSRAVIDSHCRAWHAGEARQRREGVACASTPGEARQHRDNKVKVKPTRHEVAWRFVTTVIDCASRGLLLAL